jgi:hypothetical protein
MEDGRPGILLSPSSVDLIEGDWISMMRSMANGCSTCGGRVFDDQNEARTGNTYTYWACTEK